MKEQKIDETTLNNLRELINTKSLFVQTFGQIELRRREIERQVKDLDLIEKQSNESFKTVDDQILSITKELEKKYPRGSLNLDTGIMTYKD